jgi:hypothetical protein
MPPQVYGIECLAVGPFVCYRSRLIPPSKPARPAFFPEPIHHIQGQGAPVLECKKKLFTLLDLCVSSLRRGHANLLCIVPILTDDPRRESEHSLPGCLLAACSASQKGLPGRVRSVPYTHSCIAYPSLCIPFWHVPPPQQQKNT